MLTRRKFIKTVGGSGIVLAAAAMGPAQCDQMPAEAVAAWQGPKNSLADREWILSYALLAPNPHNMQPWIVDLTEADIMTLYVDTDRLLPDTDPNGRQVLIGHGTFLELMRLAALEKGYAARIHLFPEGEPDSAALDHRPVARIELDRQSGITPDPLFAQIIHRRSNKQPYRDERLRKAHAAVLKNMPLMSGQYLDVTTKGDGAENLREFARRAMLIEMQTPHTLRESIVRTRIGADAIQEHRDGISLHGPLFWWLKRFGLMNIEDAATPGTFAYQGGMDYAMGWVDGTYNMGWLASETNNRKDQVNSGRSYVRLNLAATDAGVAMHPVSQILQEYSEMNALQKQFKESLGIPATHTVQMFFRLGYQDNAAPSPRRELTDIVRI